MEEMWMMVMGFLLIIKEVAKEVLFFDGIGFLYRGLLLGLHKLLFKHLNFVSVYRS